LPFYGFFNGGLKAGQEQFEAEVTQCMLPAGLPQLFRV
jgi:hypothetical protein